jgi:hypothetical protein
MLVFYGYQWSARDNCSRFLHDSAYFSYRNANANSVCVCGKSLSVTLLFGSFFVSFGLLQKCTEGYLCMARSQLEWDVSLVEILNKARFSFVKLINLWSYFRFPLKRSSLNSAENILWSIFYPPKRRIKGFNRG